MTKQETYQKHLIARILQEANKTMEEMEKLKLADFKRKDKNARLKDEQRQTERKIESRQTMLHKMGKDRRRKI